MLHDKPYDKNDIQLAVLAGVFVGCILPKRLRKPVAIAAGTVVATVVSIGLCVIALGDPETD